MADPKTPDLLSTDSGLATDELIRLEDTDHLLPKHWLSGSLKYDDFKPLAEGGSATIRTCLDMNLHRVVAFKTLHPHLRDSEMETRRFLREARVTAMIPHPGTVPVYELGRDREGTLYFTMKKLEGRDLRSILMDISAINEKTQRAFPVTRLVDILIQACQTVAYAHAHGVIHRDLKPANILVGAFGEVTVLDWGLAKIKGETGIETDPALGDANPLSLELTRPGQRYGTPLYMSPEQARGDVELDGRTDIYNLGSILYEVLTRKNLVWGNSVEEVLALILDSPTPRPREVAPDLKIDPELEAICLKALAKKPEDRYATIQEFAQDLQRYRDQLPVRAYRYNPWSRFRHWNRRNATWLMVLGSAAAGAGICWLFMRP